MTNCIFLEQVEIRLGGAQIFSQLSAEIQQGEFIGVFGPNGAGKSTLAKSILGLLPVASGKISVFGSSPGRNNHLIGYMPQFRTNLENTALSAFSMVAAVAHGNRWGLPWQGITLKKEILEVLKLAGAMEYAHRPFSVLSGGQKHHVALAQALVGKPRLLILDEPLASLDPGNQMRLIQCIKKIQTSTGATILFIAHDINPLLGIMDRILYMAGGNAAIGSVKRILTSQALSELYRAEIHVIRAEGRIFIVAAEGNVTETARHA
ncbi:MAG: ABC transporter ATP-binding protein [Verrucomicrobia bacterium]|nr:MAG: ABC transporter ATP-binding protein [Verrucomicrobiota bacterium]